MTQVCQHVERGVCARCEKPMRIGPAFGARMNGSREAATKPEQWQTALRDAYGRAAIRGAGESSTWILDV